MTNEAGSDRLLKKNNTKSNLRIMSIVGMNGKQSGDRLLRKKNNTILANVRKNLFGGV